MGWISHTTLEPAVAEELLLRLVYELLDAHDDTAQLVAGIAADDPDWELHLRYLRDLQRVGRETLARVDAESAVKADESRLHDQRRCRHRM
jgi:hypothetical protein